MGEPWSGGGFEGDLEAEGFELVDVVAFLAVRPAATRAARADPPRVVLVRGDYGCRGEQQR
jgi:hypothetical protein